MAQADKPVPFEIEVNEIGIGFVRINGQDISRIVHHIEIELEAGEPTRIVLHAKAVKIKTMGAAWPRYLTVTMDEKPEV